MCQSVVIPAGLDMQSPIGQYMQHLNQCYLQSAGRNRDCLWTMAWIAGMYRDFRGRARRWPRRYGDSPATVGIHNASIEAQRMFIDAVQARESDLHYDRNNSFGIIRARRDLTNFARYLVDADSGKASKSFGKFQYVTPKSA